MENPNFESNDTQSNSIDEAENAERNEQQLHTNNDWFLQVLVNAANNGRFSASITLSVGGTLVSGLLISGKEYFELLAQSLEKAGAHQNTAKDVRGFISKVYGEESDYKQTNLPSYIHLKTAKFYNSVRGIPTSDSVLWRGKIAFVDGFFIGAFHDTASDNAEVSD